MRSKRRGNGSPAARAAKPKRSSGHIPVGKARRVKALLVFLRMYGRGTDGMRLRRAFAKRVGTSYEYLLALGYGFRVASVEMAVKLEQATHGLVTREELRPDVEWASFAPRRAPSAGQARAMV